MFDDFVRRLRGGDEDAVQLADHFQHIEREAGEFDIGQPFPELVHEHHQPATIQQAESNAVKQIKRDGAANIVIIENSITVDTHVINVAEVEGVTLIVEYPAELAALRPLFKANAQPVDAGVGGWRLRQHFQQPGDTERGIPAGSGA